MKTMKLTALAAALMACKGAYAQDWSGSYVGFELGLTPFESEFLDEEEDVFYGYSFNDGLGALAGLEIGRNWQNGNFVYGVEANLTLAAASETIQVDFCSPSQHITDINGMASVMGKLGAATGNAMVYLQTGLAVIDRDDTAECDIGSANYVASGTIPALAVGIGAEFQLNDRMSIDAEWTMYHADDVYILENGVGSDEGFFDLEMQTISFGLNYKF